MSLVTGALVAVASGILGGVFQVWLADRFHRRDQVEGLASSVEQVIASLESLLRTVSPDSIALDDSLIPLGVPPFDKRLFEAGQRLSRSLDDYNTRKSVLGYYPMSRPIVLQMDTLLTSVFEPVAAYCLAYQQRAPTELDLEQITQHLATCKGAVEESIRDCLDRLSYSYYRHPSRWASMFTQSRRDRNCTDRLR